MKTQRIFVFPSWVFWSAAMAVAIGCGSNRPEPVAVSGTVTRAGGPWPKPGRLTFFPIEPAPGFPRVLGLAEFSADGKFVVQTHRSADGLMPGKYQVGVDCWEQAPSDVNPAGKNPYVAEKFRNPKSSGLELDVPLEGLPNAAIDVPRL